MKYRIRAKEAEAVRFSPGKMSDENSELFKFLINVKWFWKSVSSLSILTDKGYITATDGEWIVRDSDGILHVYDDDTFVDKYEEVGQ